MNAAICAALKTVLKLAYAAIGYAAALLNTAISVVMNLLNSTVRFVHAALKSIISLVVTWLKTAISVIVGWLINQMMSLFGSDLTAKQLYTNSVQQLKEWSTTYASARTSFCEVLYRCQPFLMRIMPKKASCIPFWLEWLKPYANYYYAYHVTKTRLLPENINEVTDEVWDKFYLDVLSAKGTFVEFFCKASLSEILKSFVTSLFNFSLGDIYKALNALTTMLYDKIRRLQELLMKFKNVLIDFYEKALVVPTTYWTFCSGEHFTIKETIEYIQSFRGCACADQDSVQADIITLFQRLGFEVNRKLQDTTDGVWSLNFRDLQFTWENAANAKITDVTDTWIAEQQNFFDNLKTSAEAVQVEYVGFVS